MTAIVHLVLRAAAVTADTNGPGASGPRRPRWRET